MYKYSARVVKFIFSFLSLFLIGCGSKLLPELKINSVTYDEKKFIVRFSGEVEKTSIAKAVSLLEDESSVALTYEFYGSTVFIFPKTGIRKNYDYKFIISNAAEDIAGCSLETNFIHEFSTRAEKIRPEVISISPKNDGKIMEELTEIKIDFSESINRHTFEEAFSVRPKFDFFTIYENEDKTVLIMPKSTLEPNKEYVLSISNKMEDLCRNSLASEYKSVFYYKQDSVEPKVSVMLKNADYTGVVENSSRIESVPVDSDIRIEFDKPMNLSTATSYFSVIPTILYTVERDEKDGRYLILDLTNVEWGKEYLLRIEKGMMDIGGNSIKEDKEYTIVFNNEKNRPVTFLEGYFQTSSWTSSEHSSDDYKLIDDLNNYTSLIMKGTDFTASAEKDCNLYLVFGCSKTSDGLDIFSVLDSVSISATNSCCSIDIRKMRILDSSEYASEYIDTLFTELVNSADSKICVVKVTFQFLNSDKEGVVTISLDKGICDSLGNSMLKEKTFVLNK
ncbi:Ig-like domain-containing protein [Treponema zioleckii]|uniref:Ig-like domain-containing protein n=1 Tax=Treponema zioleckii TaxID=331680 RepID=UPI00168B504A|nr:Ig-like domain-containing protein [Treponema zioleckii]